MKTIFTVFVFLCLITIPPTAAQATTVYDGAVLTEDVTWRGSILVHGSVVVAPHATLRIEPGTVVRFGASADQQLPILVVQGRLHIAGTSELPIVLTSDRPLPTRGSWGGIVLLSTEKNNLLEGCRIEYAETGIDIRFSTVTLKSVSILHAKTALLAHDGIVRMTGSTVSGSETGIEIYDSEFDGNDVTVASCQRGCVLSNSSILLASPRIVNNQQSGLETDDCRIKITGGEFSENTLGVRIKGGEGEVLMSRFLRNSQTALHLSGSRVKIQSCQFAENLQDALRVEDDRALIVNNAFSFNGGFNLFNVGKKVVNARLNWWGVSDLTLIRQKIHDASRDSNTGTVQIIPWLVEMPPSVL